MSERLTDDQIDYWNERIGRTNRYDRSAAERALLQATAELRSRRAADLSAEDVEALQSALIEYEGMLAWTPDATERQWRSRVVLVLSRLIAGAKP